MNAPRFRSVRFGEGYDMDEVDAFVDRVEQALHTGDDSLTPEQVLQQRFTSTRFAEGYVMDDVDRYLDEMMPSLRALREGRAGGDAEADPAGSPGPAPASATGPAASADVRGRDGLLHVERPRPGLLRRLLGGGR